MVIVLDAAGGEPPAVQVELREECEALGIRGSSGQ